MGLLLWKHKSHVLCSISLDGVEFLVWQLLAAEQTCSSWPFLEGPQRKNLKWVQQRKFTFPQTYFNILSNTIQCALQSLHEGAFNNPVLFQAFILEFRSLPFCCGAADILIGAAHFVRSPCRGISPPHPSSRPLSVTWWCLSNVNKASELDEERHSQNGSCIPELLWHSHLLGELG